jgi:hypothetical protein
MQDTTFADLTLRVGAPYLYCHQGDCQHIIMVTDVRLINKYESSVRRKGAGGEGGG